MMQKIILSFFLVITVACSRKEDVFSIELKTIEDKAFFLEEIKKNKLTAIVFISTDCPVCQNYTLDLSELKTRYEDNGIAIVGVIPGKQEGKHVIEQFIKDYPVRFTLVRDEEKKLVKFLLATITPEVFLFNARGEVIYQGRIDNRMVAAGQKRQLITERNLTDAIDSFLANKEIKVKQTTAVGCIIE